MSVQIPIHVVKDVARELVRAKWGNAVNRGRRQSLGGLPLQLCCWLLLYKQGRLWNWVKVSLVSMAFLNRSQRSLSLVPVVRSCCSSSAGKLPSTIYFGKSWANDFPLGGDSALPLFTVYIWHSLVGDCRPFWTPNCGNIFPYWKYWAVSRAKGEVTFCQCFCTS